MEFFSKRLVSIMNIGTLKVLWKVLRYQTEMLTPDRPYSVSTITIHKSGIIPGGFVPDPKYYDWINNIIRTGEDRFGDKKHIASFRTSTPVLWGNQRILLRLYEGVLKKDPQNFIGEVPLLLRSKSLVNGKVRDFAITQYFDSCPPADSMHKNWGYSASAGEENIRNITHHQTWTLPVILFTQANGLVSAHRNCRRDCSYSAFENRNPSTNTLEFLYRPPLLS